tara:strand:- start:4691 stop:5140 length:450 start_codon:yes stop_codon:yes gene_type:complete
MGAASASAQNSAMPQPPQGKGAGAPMQQGGSGAPMSGGKGFSNQQPYSPEGGYANQGSTMPPAFQQLNDQIQPNGMSSMPGNPDQSSMGQGMPQGAGQQGKGAAPQGNQITYPATSGQQQFGQPMQNSYSNTIGQNQQFNQMNPSGKGV